MKQAFFFLSFLLGFIHCLEAQNEPLTSGYRVLESNSIDFDDVRSVISSPFEPGKIWLINSDESNLELDLLSGKTVELTEKYKDKLFDRINGEFTIDTFSKQTYLFRTNMGNVFSYNLSAQKSKMIFNTDYGYPELLMTKDDIWFLTEKLMVWNRKTEALTTLENSPTIGYKSIGEIEPGKFLVGGQYIYDSNSRCWSKMETFHGVKMDSIGLISQINGSWVVQYANGARIGVLKKDGSIKDYELKTLRFGSDLVWWNSIDNPVKDILWWKGYNSMFQRINLTTDKVDVFDFEDLNIEAEKISISNTWILFEHSDLNKTYLFTAPDEWSYFKPEIEIPNTPILKDANYLYFTEGNKLTWMTYEYYFKQFQKADFSNQNAAFEALTDSLHLKDTIDTWGVRKEKMAYVRSRFSDDSNPGIGRKIEEYSQIFTFDYNPENVETMLNDTLFKLNPSLIVYGWAMPMLERGDFLNALRMEEDVKSIFKQHDRLFNFFRNIELTYNALLAVDKSPDKKPEKLIRKASILSAFEQGVYMTSQSDSLYKLILKQYPKTGWADAAKFELTNNEFQKLIGQPRWNDIKKIWEQFIVENPNSVYVPDAKVKLALLIRLDSSESEVRKAAQLMEEAIRLKPEILTRYYKHEAMLYLEIQRILSSYELGISAKLDKKVFEVDEPINIQFSIQNKTDKDTKIRLYMDPALPNFTVKVFPKLNLEECLMPIEFILDKSNSRKAFKCSKVLKANGIYEEKRNLLNSVLQKVDYNQAELGRFSIKGKGIYVLEVYYGSVEKAKKIYSTEFEVR